MGTYFDTDGRITGAQIVGEPALRQQADAIRAAGTKVREKLQQLLDRAEAARAAWDAAVAEGAPLGAAALRSGVWAEDQVPLLEANRSAVQALIDELKTELGVT